MSVLYDINNLDDVLCGCILVYLPADPVARWRTVDLGGMSYVYCVVGVDPASCCFLASIPSASPHSS